FLRAWISDFTLILLDYDAFYHARIAGEIYQGHHIPTWDAKELGGIPHYYPPNYHILMVLGKYILPEWSFLTIGSILTVFFGVITTLFVYLIGRRFSENVGLVSALLYALTPMMVLRSGLWARPTGLSMMLAIMIVYLFLEAKKGNKYATPALLVSLGYTFAHSSVLLVFSLVLATSIIAKDMYKTQTFLKIALVLLAAGALYYYRVLPHLNFYVSQKGEYMPVIRPILEFLPSGDWAALAVALLFLGIFNLAFFPVVFHGIYEMLKTQRELAIFSFISLFLVFFGANMFILLNFTVTVAIAVSIFKILRLDKMPIAVLLLLMVALMDVTLLQNVHGEKKTIYADAMEEILTDAPLTSENLVLSNDPNVGHAIPYYSKAGTFISDLTDTKQYDKNRMIFDTIIDENTTPEEAIALMQENNIDHLLIIGESLPFMEKSKQNLVRVKEIERKDFRISLYRIKK
ncbi:glycosyltransferase family 39 protein, partial [archaeon]|nr:glycosyltransferase family 39 protein [archaeon]